MSKVAGVDFPLTNNMELYKELIAASALLVERDMPVDSEEIRGKPRNLKKLIKSLVLLERVKRVFYTMHDDVRKETNCTV